MPCGFSFSWCPHARQYDHGNYNEVYYSTVDRERIVHNPHTPTTISCMLASMSLSISIYRTWLYSLLDTGIDSSPQRQTTGAKPQGWFSILNSVHHTSPIRWIETTQHIIKFYFKTSYDFIHGWSGYICKRCTCISCRSEFFSFSFYSIRLDLERRTMLRHR